MNKHAVKVRDMLNYINYYETGVNEISNKLEDYVLEHRKELDVPEHYRVMVVDGFLKLYDPVTKTYDDKLVSSLLIGDFSELINDSPWS